MSSSSSTSSFSLGDDSPNDWITTNNAWTHQHPYKPRSFTETLTTQPAFERLDVLLGTQGRDFSDVMIEVIPSNGDKVVMHAHGFLLRIHSQMMEYMSGLDDSIVQFDSVFGTDVFLELIPEAIRYCYTSRLPEDKSVCFALMSVGEFFDMPMLVCHVMDWFEKGKGNHGFRCVELMEMCRRSVECGEKGNHCTSLILRRIGSMMDVFLEEVKGTEFGFLEPLLFLGMIEEPRGMRLIESKDEGIGKFIGEYLMACEFDMDSEQFARFVELMDGINHDETMVLLSWAMATGADDSVVEMLCQEAAVKFHRGKIELKKLPLEMAKMILNDDELSVENEDIVYDLAINGDKQLVSCVRFEHLSAEKLEALQMEPVEDVGRPKRGFKRKRKKATNLDIRWDPELSTDALEIVKEGRKVKLTQMDGWQWGLGDKRMTSGKHVWKIQMDQLGWIGISEPVETKERGERALFVPLHSFGGQQGFDSEDLGGKWGDVAKLTLDLSKMTLKVTNVRTGNSAVAIVPEGKTWVPFVMLWTRGSAAEFV